MITVFDLRKYDLDDMHKVYDQWPQIARDAYNSEFEKISFDGIDHIVFSGMGGSGAIGDLFSSLLSKTNIHVSLVKGYVLPNTVDKNTLVITISISGNSQEPLTVLESAKNLDCSIIAFSSGGKMEEFCKKNQINHRKIELIHSARASFLRYVYSILKILESLLPITKNDIVESFNELENIKNQISFENLTSSNPALTLACWITKIPLIYYPHGLQSSAFRFKSSLQENSKKHVIVEDVIEACHNGIVAWEKTSTVQPILIEGKDDYVKTRERWKILKEYFVENKIDFREVHSIEGNLLSKLVVLIYFFDYVSIYNAILNEIDPSPVNSIDYIKKKLSLN